MRLRRPSLDCCSLYVLSVDKSGEIARAGRQTACKPGSVRDCGREPDNREMVIPLGRPLPDASRDQPGRQLENPPIARGYPAICRPYSVLLPVGFTLPSPLPETRCALTAPFHPYPPMTC